MDRIPACLGLIVNLSKTFSYLSCSNDAIDQSRHYYDCYFWSEYI